MADIENIPATPDEIFRFTGFNGKDIVRVIKLSDMTISFEGVQATEDKTGTIVNRVALPFTEFYAFLLVMVSRGMLFKLQEEQWNWLVERTDPEAAKQEAQPPKTVPTLDDDDDGDKDPLTKRPFKPLLTFSELVDAIDDNAAALVSDYWNAKKERPRKKPKPGGCKDPLVRALLRDIYDAWLNPSFSNIEPIQSVDDMLGTLIDDLQTMRHNIRA